ncbi:hypothetical protein GGI12_001824 [Dipsacomyces acuminosporus]|nr:hypothetical protein GGI12_001824 [Dipsacomyces acuminosporus]
MPAAAAAAAAADGSSHKNGDCPDDPKLITCPNGQSPIYIPQNTEQCAHFTCSDSGATSATPSSSSSGKGASKGVTVVLPAVLGTLFLLLFMGVGVFFYMRRKRSSSSASSSNRHSGSHLRDSKHLSAYNNMTEISRAYLPSQVSYAASQSGYTTSEEPSHWRSSLSTAPRASSQLRDSVSNHASVPIYFSDNYEPRSSSPLANRETQLFNTGAISRQQLRTAGSARESQRWPVSGVVDVKSRITKPQLVVLNQGQISDEHLDSSASQPATDPHTSLNINIANVRVLQPDLDTASPNSPGLPEDNPQSPGITSVTAPLTSQMPRLVQIGVSPLRLDSTGSVARPATTDTIASGLMSKPVSRTGRESARLSIGAEQLCEPNAEDSFAQNVFQATQNLRLGDYLHDSSVPDGQLNTNK